MGVYSNNIYIGLVTVNPSFTDTPVNGLVVEVVICNLSPCIVYASSFRDHQYLMFGTKRKLHQSILSISIYLLRQLSLSINQLSIRSNLVKFDHESRVE